MGAVNFAAGHHAMQDHFPGSILINGKLYNMPPPPPPHINTFTWTDNSMFLRYINIQSTSNHVVVFISTCTFRIDCFSFEIYELHDIGEILLKLVYQYAQISTNHINKT